MHTLMSQRTKQGCCMIWQCVRRHGHNVKANPVQGKLLRYWGQDPRAELVASSKVLPYRAEPLYDLAQYHAVMSATAGCPRSPAPGATPSTETCGLLHIAAAYHYARRAAALPIPAVVSHPWPW